MCVNRTGGTKTRINDQFCRGDRSFESNTVNKMNISKSLNRTATCGEGAELYRLLRGENLDILRTLKNSGESFDLVYLDPPYNTRRKLRYKDRFGERGGHKEWVSYLGERLTEILILCKETGLVAVSIDARELAHLVLLMDSIFKESNRIALISVKVKSGAGLSVNPIMDTNEYLVVYAKNIQNWKNKILTKRVLLETRGEYQRRFINMDEGRLIRREGGLEIYEHTAETEVVKESKLLRKGIKKEYVENVFCTTNSQGVSKIIDKIPKKGIYRVVNNNGEETWFRNGRVILWLRDRVEIINGRLYRNERETTWWDGNVFQGLGAEGGVSFKEGKKPVAFLQRMLEWFGPDAQILDPFAGSGSMIQAVAEKNRGDGGTRECTSIDLDENNTFTEKAWPRIKGVLEGKLPNGREVSKCPGSAGFYDTTTETGTDRDDK